MENYFKPLALSFGSRWKSAARFDIPPDNYLIISVSKPQNPVFISEALYMLDKLAKMRFLFLLLAGKRQCLLGNFEWVRSGAAGFKCHWRYLDAR